MMQPVANVPLEAIPVVECSHNFPLETLTGHDKRAHDLLDRATKGMPAFALRQLDRASKAWLEKWSNSHLEEIAEIARRLDRPGAYFFSVNYEWGCTCRVSPSPDHKSARLIRVLDWKTPGLGRNVLAARVAAKAGPYVTLTWPGYTGVLTAMAPGRFAGALNQAPMRKACGYFYFDWAVNRRRVWTMPHATPAHLLRAVFDEAPTFEDAKRILKETPISTPGIFSLAGVKPNETVVIERTETEARVYDGAQVAANHWQSHGWQGHERGADSSGRACRMHRITPEFDPSFKWLEPPILNARTRIAMVADAAEGRLVAQGFEHMAPATRPLDLRLENRLMEQDETLRTSP